MKSAITDETMRLVTEARSKGGELIQRGFTTASGLYAYDLEPAAKLLYPVLTPLRNRIPRAGGGVGSAAEWKAITAINTGGIRVVAGEGNRSAVLAQTTKSYSVGYKTLGLENNLTFESESAGEGFDDLKAKAALNLMQAMMIGEELLILGGNSSIALGTCGTPTLAENATGGSIPSTDTIYVYCVELTLEGYKASSVTAGLPGQVSRTNADGTTETYGGGNGKISAVASLSPTAGSTNTIRASVTLKKGVVAWAWYWHNATGAANAKLGAITTVNSYEITTPTASGTQAANDAKVTTDYSQNALTFDGFLSTIMGVGPEVGGSAPAGLYAGQATGTPGTGTPLTSDGAGGITEINTDLKAFWDNYRLGPDTIYVSAQELENITNKVITSGGTPLIRFNMDNAAMAQAVAAGTIGAGIVVGTYLNKFTNELIKIVVHPDMPPGTLLYYDEEIPYPLSGVGEVVRMKTRREYYQLEWALQTRKYEYGVYAEEILQMYAPFAFGVRHNIANG